MLKACSLIVITIISFAPFTIRAQERLLVSYAGFAGFQAPAWAAKDLGLFSKYGLNIELVMIPGSARGAQALLGGSTHFGQIDGTALIAAINQGADLVLISASLNKFPFSLVAQKQYHQAGRFNRQKGRHRGLWRRP